MTGIMARKITMLGLPLPLWKDLPWLRMVNSLSSLARMAS